MKTMSHKQRGMGFFGFILVAAGIIFVAILGMKLVPPYIHSAQISQILKSIAKDPAMQDASLNDIRSAYQKRADINYITDIKASDLEISKGDGVLSLSTSYTIKMPLVGNITLLLEFNPSSS